MVAVCERLQGSSMVGPISLKFARHRALLARIWAIFVFPGARFGRGVAPRRPEAIRRIASGSRKSAPRPKSVPETQSIVRAHLAHLIVALKMWHSAAPDAGDDGDGAGDGCEAGPPSGQTRRACCCARLSRRGRRATCSATPLLSPTSLDLGVVVAPAPRGGASPVPAYLSKHILSSNSELRAPLFGTNPG